MLGLTSFSRYQYAELVFDQQVSTWIACHRRHPDPQPQLQAARRRFDPAGTLTAAGPFDNDKDAHHKPRRLTEEQKQRTDTSSLDDTRTEGNVLAVRCVLEDLVGDLEDAVADRHDGLLLAAAGDQTVV